VQAAVQSALRGRTYFYDPDTMRYFECRVQSARIMFDGIVIGTICTQAVNGYVPNSGRCYTINFHDLTGFCLNGREHERQPYMTRTLAEMAFSEFAATLTGGRVLGDAIRRERDSKARDLRDLRRALRNHGKVLA
jgi:hypothetical protein